MRLVIKKNLTNQWLTIKFKVNKCLKLFRFFFIIRIFFLEKNINFRSDNSSLDCLPIDKNGLKFVNINDGIYMLNGTQLNVLSVSSSSNNRSTLKTLGTIDQINGQIIDIHVSIYSVPSYVNTKRHKYVGINCNFLKYRPPFGMITFCW